MRRDDIRALHEQRRSLHGEMLKLNATAEEEGRDLTAEEAQEFDRMETEYEELETRARRAEKLYMHDRETEKNLSTSIETRIGTEDDLPKTFAEYRAQRFGQPPWDEPEVRAATYRYWSVGNVSALDVEEQRALSKATGAAGAFLVPTDLETAIIRAERFMGSIASLANVVDTDSGETLNIAVNSAHGAAVWTAESAALTPSDETFAQVALGAHKATRKIIVSSELLEDAAFDLEGLLAQEFGESIGVLEETAYVNGDGSGKPTGILPNITSITAATGAGNVTTFTYTAIATLVYTVPTQYRSGASFVVSDLAARNLRLLLDTTGQPLWATNVAAGAPDSFMGYPIYTHPDMPAPGSGNKSMMFGNWRRAYTIRRVRGFSIVRQNELHSDNDQVGFKGTERVDGKVVLADAARSMTHPAT
jgi:HK97 family phage major capsid protein